MSNWSRSTHLWTASLQICQLLKAWIFERASLEGLFDGPWYLEQNPDARWFRPYPLLHYLIIGARHHRNPHPLFDTNWYLTQNPDVAAAGALPLLHYLRFGHAEGRDPHPLFDIDWYLAHNADAAASGANPLAHYLQYGHVEGHDPHPLFDTDWYLAQNPDVAAAGLNPLAHYVQFGSAEGRDPHPLFDTDWYLSQNADVAAARVNPLAHYVEFGSAEGRDPNPLFNTIWYLTHNPGVSAAGAAPLVHYHQVGRAQGRDPSPDFDTDWYLDVYPDVAQAGTNPLVHYIHFGAKEGRKPKRGGVAICSIFKNEAPFIREWIAYHSSLGVSHFVLYDNESDDGGALNIGHLKDQVTIIPWPTKTREERHVSPQFDAYEHFIREYGSMFEWAAFIDLDEYITPVSNGSLPDLLATFEDVSLLLVNWLNYGPWGDKFLHEVRPTGLIMEEYTFSFPKSEIIHRHVKSIARMRDVTGVKDCHVIATSGRACNALGEAISNDAVQPSACHEVLYLSHFYTRSREDFQTKVSRGRADRFNVVDDARHIEWFEEYVAKATVENKTLARFIPQVRALLSNPGQPGTLGAP